MNEQEQKLYRKYPKLFAEVGLPPSQSCMAFGIECGPGWLPIIESVCSLVQNHIDSFRSNAFYAKSYNRALKQALRGNVRNLHKYFSRTYKSTEEIEKKMNDAIQRATFREVMNVPTQMRFTQIKEKYGTLRIYTSGGDDFCEGVISMAESWSSVTCEECGKQGKTIYGGWIRTLCVECEQLRKKKATKCLGY